MGVAFLPILGCLVWIIMEIVLGSVVVAATVLMVATAYMVRELNNTFFINIAGEATWLLTFRTSGFNAWTILLKMEPELTHRYLLSVHQLHSALLHFALPFHRRVLIHQNPKVQKCIVQMCNQ